MNLKRKNFRLPAIAMVLACMALTAVSCGGKKNVSTDTTDTSNTTTDTTDTPDTRQFATDSITWNDSVATPAGNKAFCSISVEWPVEGTEDLLTSVRSWIARKLTTPPIGEPNDTTLTQLPTECLTNGKELIATTGGLTLKSAKDELAGLDLLSSSHPFEYEYLWKINDIYHTDRFVTYGCMNYVYLGGAHGGTTFMANVFRLDDGKEFGWDMFRQDALSRLTELVKTGLMKQFFNVESEAEFRDALLVNADTLPLPVAAPYFMAEGVVFSYQQYEITDYATGMPACVLPYNTVKPLLTNDAASLLPAE